MNRNEQKIETMRQRISTGRTKEIMLLEQLIELKAENATLREEAMKSIRHTILAALAKEPLIMDGLIDATGLVKRQLTDNMQAAINDGLVARSKDAVTGMLLYTITPAGKKRLAEGPQSKGGEAMQKLAQKKAEKIVLPPPAAKPMSRVDVIARNGNDGLHYDECDASVGATVQEIDELPTADASLLASANRMLHDRLAGVAHALRGSGLPALAEIDDGEELQQDVAALTGAFQIALAELDGWDRIAASFGCATRGELVGHIETLQRESIKGVTCISRPVPRPPMGYACMVGGAEIYPDETAARMAAETALIDFPAGGRVAVVAIVASAENVIAPLWKEAA